MVEEKYDIENETIEDVEQNRIIVEEAPLASDMEQDLNLLSFNDYCNRTREDYLDKGIKEDEWRIHQLFLTVANKLELSNNEINLISYSDYDIRQKEILIFLLFAKLFDKETLSKNFFAPEISAEEMITKITFLLNEKATANYREIYEDASAIYKESLDNYIKEKEHFEEQYLKLNESYRNLNVECLSYRNENDNLKKEYEALLNEIEALKHQLKEKENVVNDLKEEKTAEDERVKSVQIEEETNKKIEERAKEIAQDILAKEEEKRLEKESIERAAVEKYKQEHNINETSFTKSKGSSDNNVLQLLAMQQMNINRDSSDNHKKKEKRFFGRKNRKKEENTEKQFYGFDLQSCLVNANLNNAQMQVITFAITHDISENVLVNAINHNCSADQLKAIVEAQLAQRMKENKKKELEEAAKHQQEVNDYGTYTQEDAKYGE